MRGKPDARTRTFALARITPAYAGKTQRGLSQGRLPGDHPRVCGENRLGEGELGKERGSPPRMRGKRIPRPARQKPHGITPAYAGKTHAFPFLSICKQDHPRVCGENQARREPRQSAPGSPPRMRGKPIVLDSSMQARRITPAYAGKTEYYAFPDEETGDHPRVCGENSDITSQRSYKSWITPAYAGKTL